MNLSYDPLTKKINIRGSGGSISLSEAEYATLTNRVEFAKKKGALPWSGGAVGGGADADLGHLVNGSYGRKTALWDYRQVWEWYDARPQVKEMLLTGNHLYPFGDPYTLFKIYVRLCFEWNRLPDQRSILSTFNPDISDEDKNGQGKATIGSFVDRWVKLGLGVKSGGKFIPTGLRRAFIVPESEPIANQEELLSA